LKTRNKLWLNMKKKNWMWYKERMCVSCPLVVIHVYTHARTRTFESIRLSLPTVDRRESRRGHLEDDSRREITISTEDIAISTPLASFRERSSPGIPGGCVYTNCSGRNHCIIQDGLHLGEDYYWLIRSKRPRLGSRLVTGWFIGISVCSPLALQRTPRA